MTVGALTPASLAMVALLGWQVFGNFRWKSHITPNTARAEGDRADHNPQSIISDSGKLDGEGFNVTVDMAYLRLTIPTGSQDQFDEQEKDGN